MISISFYYYKILSHNFPHPMADNFLPKDFKKKILIFLKHPMLDDIIGRG